MDWRRSECDVSHASSVHARDRDRNLMAVPAVTVGDASGIRPFEYSCRCAAGGRGGRSVMADSGVSLVGPVGVFIASEQGMGPEWTLDLVQ